MLMGSSKHISWVVKKGFLSEKRHESLGSSLFWEGMTFLHQLAALLLFVKSKSGLLLTALIIIVDVVHNNLFYADELYFTQNYLGN
jgi:hypothetical protein